MQSSGGKKDSTYLDDVFSTYLYKGNKPSSQAIENGLKLGNSNTGNSVLFDDTDDYLQIAHTTDLCFGNGDFTIECWAYYRGDFDSFDGLFGNWTGSGDNGYILETVGSGATTDLEFYWYKADGNYILVQGGTVSKDQWNHLCVCRSGNTIRVFVNGTMHGSGTSMTEGIRDGTSNFTIGGEVAGGGYWNGYITNLRVTKGQGLYTSNFTPSTAALTTTSQGATASNVKLLCCNKDTVTGKTVGPTITAFGPIASGFGAFTGTDGEGGLVWIKSRSNTYNHILQDTENGTGKFLISNATNAATNTNQYITSFNNNGFTVGTDNDINNSSQNFASWSFRKAEGFCDIVKFTGSGGTNASPQTINHSLKSIPGMIIIKNLTQAGQWFVYHKSTGVDKFLQLNKTDAAIGYNGGFKNITSSSIDVFDSNSTNTNEFIAYVFAGGESTAATAKSVYLDGSNDYITIDDTSSGEMATGTGDFTVEMWVKPNGYNLTSVGPGIWSGTGNNSLQIWMNGSGHLKVSLGPNTSSGVLLTYTGAKPPVGQWTHLAFVRNGNNGYLYLNGIEVVSGNVNSGSYNSGTIYLGRNSGMYTGSFQAYYSNVRFTTSALYTSAFKPSTEPLTNITNTKLLCCNNSSTTGSTVTPGTIAVGSVPVASSDSPFDDPEGFKFGEKGDQNIIKTGSYVGNGSNTIDIDVNLGWEPTFLLVKQTVNSGNWQLVDSATHWPVSGNWETIRPNLNQAAYFATETGAVLTPTGFKIVKDYGNFNTNGDTMVYMAIRSPDGYVGKPAEVGTDVFSLATGTNNTIPGFVSGFPVDFSLRRVYASSSDWFAASRLTGTNYLRTNTNDAQASNSNQTFDFQNGMGNWGGNLTTYMSWQWKRGAGFNVVTYTGDLVAGRQIPHSLNKIPEMLWVKRRNDNSDWIVWHKGLNGGTNSGQYYVGLNSSNPESSASYYWNNTTQNSKTFFTLGGNAAVNGENDTFISMLFASVDGISKVGYYTGTGNNQSVTTGFQPRFILIRRTSYAEDWFVFDSLRGLVSSSADPYLRINSNAAQTTTASFFDISSTGFTVTANFTNNANNYIYYAHA